MLNAIRSGTKSWVVKAFLGVIILSFAVWGVGDIFRGGSDPAVASVGGTDIPASAFNRDLDIEISRLRTMSGGQIDAEQARALGIVEQTLDGVITRAALDTEARSLELDVPEARVAAAIRDSRDFRNELGQFDRRLFEYVLRQFGMNEQQYVAQMRNDLKRSQIINGLIDGLLAPAPLVDAVARYREERRRAEIVVVDADSITDVPDPTPEQARTFYDDNPDLFTAPEYRRLSYVALRPADLMDEIELDPEEVRAEYEARLPQLETPDRRDLDMFVVTDKETADAAYERLIKGEDFLAVGQELTDSAADDLRLGMVTIDALPAELADATFALEEGRIGGPFESAFGWHLFRVNTVEAGKTPTLTEARAEIETDLKVGLAIDAVYELSNQFEDSRAGGGTLEEAAAAIGVSAKTVPSIDAYGLDPSEDYAADQLNTPEFLRTAFELMEGEESTLIEAPGNILYVVRVDTITDPALKPFDRVADDVAAAWRESEQARRAEEIATAIAEASAINGDLLKAAGDRSVPVTTTTAFTRDGRDLEDPIGQSLISAVFELAPGKVSEPIDLGRNRFAVAKLVAVEDADAAALDSARAEQDRELQLAIQNELVGAYQAALRDRLGVSINTTVVQQFITGSP